MFQKFPVELTKKIITFFVSSPDEKIKKVDIDTIGKLMQVDRLFYGLCRERYIWEFYYSTFFKPLRIAKNSKHIHYKIEKGNYGQDVKTLCINKWCQFYWVKNVDMINDYGLYMGHELKYKKYCKNIDCYINNEKRPTETKFEIDELINKCSIKTYKKHKKNTITNTERKNLTLLREKIELMKSKLNELEKKSEKTKKINNRFSNIFIKEQEIINKKKLKKQKTLEVKKAYKLERLQKKKELEKKRIELELKRFFKAFQICPQDKPKVVRKKLTEEEKAEREIKRFFKNLNIF